ncbi:MAG: hypothetical protein ABI797_07360 [Chloroflexota bacterium]
MHDAPMEVTLAAEKLYVLEERLTIDEVTQRAMDRRTGALGSLLSKPKPEEVTLLTRQRRLEPFWHVAGHATYLYERNRDYNVPSSAADVEAITVNGTRYDGVASGQSRVFKVQAREHCKAEFRSESFINALTGQPLSEGPQLISGPRSEVTDPATIGTDDTIVVPPEHRASYVVRALMSEIMKPVQADQVLEESVTLEATELFYRPIWAFEFAWTAKGKQAIVEVDSVTGQVAAGRALVGQIKGMLNRDLLFDVGADTVGLIVPGGSIAVKLAKAAMDQRK